MDMKKKLSNHTKYTIAFLSVILLFLFIFQVIAQTSAPAPNPGHQASSVSVDYPGAPDDVQLAITDLDSRIGAGGGGGSGGNGLETLTGFTVELVAHYDSLGTRKTHYRVLDPSGTQIHPTNPNPCTSGPNSNCPSVTTPQHGSVTPGYQSEIHDSVFALLRASLNFQEISQAIGKSGLIYFKIINHAPIPGNCQGYMCGNWGVTDFNFDIEFVTQPAPAHYKFECPNTCDEISYTTSPHYSFISCTPNLPIQNEFDPSIGCCSSSSSSCKPDYIQL